MLKMPVYIRKGPAHISGPLDNDQREDDEESFLKDPDQLQDQLPQPFRMIDKVLNRILDMAWDVISESERESAEKAEQSNQTVPVVQLPGKFKLPERTNCLVCSDDGRYIFMGHSQGLSVSTTCSLLCVSTWLEDRLEITSIHITGLGETAYLVGTIDDMGVARLYTFHTDNINLFKVFNEAEDLNLRSLCIKFELSKGGDFGALSISCNGARSLEVYRFPKEAWLKELKEQTASQKQAQHPAGIGDVKLLPVTLLLKIKPPKTPTGAVIKSPFEVLQKTEEGSIFGIGQNHLVSSRQWEDQDALFRSKYRKYLITNLNKTKVTEEKPSNCTSHFLLPGGLFPVLGGAKSQPGVPVSVCMWWSGSHNLQQYLLCKPAKDKSDIEPKPDVLWPNAHEILCSSVSSCTRYVSLGLATGLVSVWDRYFGLPLSVLSVTTDSALSGMMFVDYRPLVPEEVHLVYPVKTKVYVLVTCLNGTRLILTIGQGVSSHAVKLIERPAETGSLPTSTAPVPFAQGLVLLMYRDGKMLLQDVINNTNVCRFILPDTHLLATPWDPVYALDLAQQTLFIRGDQHIGHCEYVEAEDRETESQVFVLRFSESVLLKPYLVAPRESQKEQTGTNFSNLEEACNHYLQQRVLCVKERNTVMTQTWNQLQQHAATALQSNRRHGNTTTS